jgi:2-polyprenyl-3-methyl-5-hydroxy-6-metoxy-1,4-benzoquinol methylase
LLNNPILKEQIHKANITVHQFEAKYYELLHPEVYSKQEQKRITTKLKAIDTQILNNQKNALDIGAGTGNLTGKLLQMGYKVVAIDISAEMTAILKKKYANYMPNKLEIINSPIEDLSFNKDQFDLITSYSVLHHLPDYLTTLQTLFPFIKDIYFHSNPAINSIYFQLIGLKVPTIDYTLSDYWHKKEHSINHQIIEQAFKEKGFEFLKRTDYYQHGTWTPNPLFQIYRLLCRPEICCWIAKK